jgi:vacuolar-type H+-ATPase subunit H
MIDGIIKKIVETENQSDLLIKKAFDEAKLLVQDAEEVKKSMIEDTKRYMKEERLKTIALAEEIASKNYNEIIAKGKLAAEDLIKTTNTAELAAYLTKIFKEKYGSN